MADQPELSALDLIANEARVGETEMDAAAKVAAGEDQAPAIDPAEAWAQIPAMFGGILAMAMPELKEAYTPAACLTWGQAMTAVSDKYGWEAGEVMAKWGPEIALTMATVPLALPVVKAIRDRKEAAKEKTPEATPEKPAPYVMGAEGLPTPGGFVEPG
jgi:hypothetical protein